MHLDRDVDGLYNCILKYNFPRRVNIWEKHLLIRF